MEKITVIIPVHELKKELLNNAINSVPSHKDVSIMVVAPKSVIDEMNDGIIEKYNLNVIQNDGETDFCNQINLGVSKCETNYFSILEIDDLYTPIWFNNVEKYLTHYKEEVSVFLPISKMVKYDDNNIVSLINEIAWSSAFADENGFINTDCLNSYYDFLTSGGVFKTNDFKNLGGFKPSLSIASSYELLLRYAHNSKKIFIIPKVGYVHAFGNPESYSVKMAKQISQKHGEWLIKLAQEEKFFNEDRNKVFEE